MSNEYHLSSEDLVESLVDAVSRNGDFKQLSSYSIQCISKRLDYKHPEFCDLLNRVIDSNTGDAIMRNAPAFNRKRNYRELSRMSIEVML